MHKSDNFRIKWIELYPDKPWNFQALVDNINFKIEWVDKYPEAS